VSDKTLHEALAELGWSSSASSSGHKQGRIVRDEHGRSLGVLTAGETWAELRARGLIGAPERGAP
jgi:hypothetical protein